MLWSLWSKGMALHIDFTHSFAFLNAFWGKAHGQLLCAALPGCICIWIADAGSGVCISAAAPSCTDFPMSIACSAGSADPFPDWKVGSSVGCACSRSGWLVVCVALWLGMLTPFANPFPRAASACASAPWMGVLIIASEDIEIWAAAAARGMPASCIANLPVQIYFPWTTALHSIGFGGFISYHTAKVCLTLGNPDLDLYAILCSNHFFSLIWAWRSSCCINICRMVLGSIRAQRLWPSMRLAAQHLSYQGCIKNLPDMVLSRVALPS